jgi:glutamate synthase (ferredoxin)
MSGGVAYVLDEDGTFVERCNGATVALEALDADDLGDVRTLLERHLALTSSDVARRLVRYWRRTARQLVKVMPEEYKRALRAHLELVS